MADAVQMQAATAFLFGGALRGTPSTLTAHRVGFRSPAPHRAALRGRDGNTHCAALQRLAACCGRLLLLPLPLALPLPETGRRLISQNSRFWLDAFGSSNDSVAHLEWVWIIEYYYVVLTIIAVLVGFSSFKTDLLSQHTAPAARSSPAPTACIGILGPSRRPLSMSRHWLGRATSEWCPLASSAAEESV